MMLSERNMMQLSLVPKALPFLIHMNICLTSQLPGRPSVLCLLLSIAHFSVYCSDIIKILGFVYHRFAKKVSRYKGNFLS